MQGAEGEEVEEVEEFREGEDEECEDPVAGSRLARKVTNFGMAAGRYYTPGRMRSETFDQVNEISFLANLIFKGCPASIHSDFTLL
jgi:hypothetical protein